MDTVTRLRRTWDWVLGVACLGLAAVVLTAGAMATSGAHHVADQLSFIISGGLGGLLLLAAGSTLVIAAALTDEARKLDRLEAALPFDLPGVALRSTTIVLRRGRILAAGGLAVALTFVVVAWIRASGAADPNPEAFEAVGTGAIGLLIGALVAALATMRMKRSIQLRKSLLFAPWTAAHMIRGYELPSRTDTGSLETVLVAAGLTRFHTPGCMAVAGLPTRAVDAQDLPPGLTPCELCLVDAADHAAVARSVLA